MSILDLLKKKTANEKQNFLNSIRIKASTKLKNTDDNKIIDIISIVDAFNSSLSVTNLKEEFDEAIRIIKKYYKTNFRV